MTQTLHRKRSFRRFPSSEQMRSTSVTPVQTVPCSTVSRWDLHSGVGSLCRPMLHRALVDHSLACVTQRVTPPQPPTLPDTRNPLFLNVHQRTFPLMLRSIDFRRCSSQDDCSRRQRSVSPPRRSPGDGDDRIDPPRARP